MDGEFLRAMKNIDKNLKRIADALEKQKPRTINVQGRADATEQDRKELANAIREILLNHAESQYQSWMHRSEQQPCPTEHKPDSEG